MDEELTTIHITKALYSSMIVELIDKYPNLEEITCSPSVYKITSKTYIDALSQLDIEVRQKYNWGAKSKSNGIEYYVQKLSKYHKNLIFLLTGFIICLKKAILLLTIENVNMIILKLNNFKKRACQLKRFQKNWICHKEVFIIF